jgi:hypothetical protein
MMKIVYAVFVVESSSSEVFQASAFFQVGDCFFEGRELTGSHTASALRLDDVVKARVLGED